MLVSVVACSSPTADPSDPVATAKAWIETQIKQNSLFSFDFDGKAYTDHIGRWRKRVETEENAWTVTYKKGDVVAWSEITLDEDTASVEWTNYFKNEGSSDSPVIANIQAIDSVIEISNPILTSTKGSKPSPTDFQPYSIDLVEAKLHRMATSGGRSSQEAWPYFDICNGEYGVIGGIGWTGDWDATFTYEEDAVHIVAGMKETNISLHAGESMRTPLFMLQFFVGNQDAGHNAFRQLILKNYTPSDESGKPISHAPMWVSANASYGEDFLIEAVEKTLAVGRRIDGLWIDANWYGELTPGAEISDMEWFTQVGNWYFTPSAFPNGNMLKTSNYLEEKGLELLVWFEPERAIPGTKLTVEHPEWFLSSEETGDDFLVYDFTNDEACDYMINWISSVIRENKITWYRQDFNCEPDRIWKANDENDTRVGMTEIRYITNLYRFLDGLVENNPGLMLDNCASGGKRLDLEMMKRSVPLWRSDVTTGSEHGSNPDNVRSINYNLSWWLPIHAGGYPYMDSKSELYNMRSFLSSGSQLIEQHQNTAPVFQAIDEYYTYRDMMVGDYYMLSYGTNDAMYTVNAAYQYYLPQEGRGFVMTFRPAQSTEESSRFVLKGLDAASTYQVTMADTGDTLTMTGQELMTEGIGCVYPIPAFSLLIYINKA